MQRVPRLMKRRATSDSVKRKQKVKHSRTKGRKGSFCPDEVRTYVCTIGTEVKRIKVVMREWNGCKIHTHCDTGMSDCPRAHVQRGLSDRPE